MKVYVVNDPLGEGCGIVLVTTDSKLAEAKAQEPDLVGFAVVEVHDLVIPRLDPPTKLPRYSLRRYIALRNFGATITCKCGLLLHSNATPHLGEEEERDVDIPAGSSDAGI